MSLTVAFARWRPSVIIAPSDIPARIAHLDANGIQRQLLDSHRCILAWMRRSCSQSCDRCIARSNDELVEVVRKNLSHLLAVAALPASDPEWTAEELYSRTQGARLHRRLAAAQCVRHAGGRAHRRRRSSRQLKKLGSHFFVHRGPANASIPGQPPLEAPTDTDSRALEAIRN